MTWLQSCIMLLRVLKVEILEIKMVNKFGYLKKSILENIDNFKNNEIERDEELGWFKEIVDNSNYINKIKSWITTTKKHYLIYKICKKMI